ncbi:TIGR04552 family protein [Massilia sp. TS11]|uniref:TIGR04552 family protein n=1 Tax=Massilia sp. TS11 TaxID=2908003 RepID=UPI001EDC17A1|nr:TIGR04552 family protein [Massilia sp. TS11]MCG2585065.1 TIGR04552 family protein [Massilia sp. TS11]
MTHLHATLASKRKFSINWTYLSAITQGRSAIDLESLALRNLHDAHQFVREYGYDLAQPAGRAIVARVHAEAVAFIGAHFLTPQQAAAMPAAVAAAPDPAQLLVYASQHGLHGASLRDWSCAVLKVMHAIFYLENNLKLRHFNTIRAQVFATLDSVIRHEDGASYLSDGDLCLPLLHFDRKHNKGRESILLKLLHKASYVAANIHDHLGVRLIFHTRFECLLALEALQRAHLLSITNLDAARTRNTLLDLAAAKQVFVQHRAQLERAHGYPAALLRQMDAELARIAHPQTQADNAHSGEGFNSLQVTVRKMIHLPPEPGQPASYEQGFYFEYEIQLMDQAAYERSQHGPASHAAYKQRQLAAARRRVLGARLCAALEPAAAGLTEHSF